MLPVFFTPLFKLPVVSTPLFKFPPIFFVQVDAADDMWPGGRAAGSKMLLEDVDVDDDLVPGLGPATAAAGGGGIAGGSGSAGLLSVEGDASGAAAMDATS